MMTTYPYIRNDAKEWRKELAVTMVKKVWEKLKLKEVGSQDVLV